MALMFRLVLILSLIAVSVLSAPMRGQMAGVSQIEICSDAGTEVITLDAAGNPVAAHPPCPDCLACTSFGPVAQTPLPAFAGAVRPLVHAVPQGGTAAGRQAFAPAARGPPLPV